METKFSEVANLYYGCKAIRTDYNQPVIWDMESVIFFERGEYKPILRPLHSITEDEVFQYMLIIFSDVEEKIDPMELSISLHKGDGGNMVDENMQVVAEVSCRCFEGQIAFSKRGSPILYDEDGEVREMNNAPQGFMYLLKQGFDLFSLIQSGEAIDRTTLP